MAAPLPADYPNFFELLKAQIRQAQVGAALAVNRELILLYSCAIAIAELRAWGAFIERRPAMLEPLATDVQHRIATAARTIDYFWFLGGTPQPFDLPRGQPAFARELPAGRSRATTGGPDRHPRRRRDVLLEPH